MATGAQQCSAIVEYSTKCYISARMPKPAPAAILLKCRLRINATEILTWKIMAAQWHCQLGTAYSTVSITRPARLEYLMCHCVLNTATRHVFMATNAAREFFTLAFAVEMKY